SPPSTRDYRSYQGEPIVINAFRAIRAAIRTIRKTVQSSGFHGMPMFLSFTATHYQKYFFPGDSKSNCIGADKPVGDDVVAYAEKKSFSMKLRDQLRW
ncbi:unnamed protein product, partial [Closterium sp. Naga37s-1]